MSTLDDSVLEQKGVKYIRGLAVFALYKNEFVEQVLDFTPEDGDVIISTFPKTGTTWMQYIVHQILTRGAPMPTFNDLLQRDVPHIEFAGLSSLDNVTTRPRAYKLHFPYDMLKINPQSKIIYVYRHPADAIVSYYYFMVDLIGLASDFDQFFEDFMDGLVPYGKYFDHILSYYEHRHDGHILFVSYEKLLANRKEEILKVARFIGEEHYTALLEDEHALKKVMEHTEFDYMQKNIHLIFAKNPKEVYSNNPDTKEVIFFRKGVSGEGKKTLNKEQSKRLKELARKKLYDTEIFSEWYGD